MLQTGSDYKRLDSWTARKGRNRAYFVVELIGMEVHPPNIATHGWRLVLDHHIYAD